MGVALGFAISSGQEGHELRAVFIPAFRFGGRHGICPKHHGIAFGVRAADGISLSFYVPRNIDGNSLLVSVYRDCLMAAAGFCLKLRMRAPDSGRQKTLCSVSD